MVAATVEVMEIAAGGEEEVITTAVIEWATLVVA